MTEVSIPIVIRYMIFLMFTFLILFAEIRCFLSFIFNDCSGVLSLSTLLDLPLAFAGERDFREVQLLLHDHVGVGADALFVA